MAPTMWLVSAEVVRSMGSDETCRAGGLLRGGTGGGDTLALVTEPDVEGVREESMVDGGPGWM